MYIWNTYLFTHVVSQNYVFFRIQWFFHEQLIQNSMIFPWFFHFCKFKKFSWNSMIFPWSWNRSQLQWFFKSCGNPADELSVALSCKLAWKNHWISWKVYNYYNYKNIWLCLCGVHAPFKPHVWVAVLSTWSICWGLQNLTMATDLRYFVAVIVALWCYKLSCEIKNRCHTGLWGQFCLAGEIPTRGNSNSRTRSR